MYILDTLITCFASYPIKSSQILKNYPLCFLYLMSTFCIGKCMPRHLASKETWRNANPCPWNCKTLVNYPLCLFWLLNPMTWQLTVHVALPCRHNVMPRYMMVIDYFIISFFLFNICMIIKIPPSYLTLICKYHPQFKTFVTNIPLKFILMCKYYPQI